MSKFYALLFLLMALLLGNCTYVNTHRACADRGRQCKAIILPDQENLVLYRHKGKLYLEGVLTEVRRVGRDKVSNYSVNEFSSGQYIPIANAPRRFVYRELQPSDIVPDDTFALKPGKSIPKGATPTRHRRQITGYSIDSLNCNPVTTALQHGWLEQQPRHARRVQRHMVTSEHQTPGHHLCNTHRGFIIPVTSMRSNAHAWYAYPLAGLSFIVIDVPGTVLASTVVPLSYGIAAIPCSIYQKTRQLIVRPDK